MVETWWSYPNINRSRSNSGLLKGTLAWPDVSPGLLPWPGSLENPACKRLIHLPTEEQLADFIFWAAVGVVVGGRTGYVLFYNFGQFLQDPPWLF